MATPPVAPSIQPKSLEGHAVPDDRLALIAAHMKLLGAAALEASDTLPLEADGGDFVATLEREGE